MPSVDDIIVVNQNERITTSIDSYFKNIAVIAEFTDSDLNDSKTFSTDRYEVYTSIGGVAEKFPTTHAVYKEVKSILDQKNGKGVNKSNVEKVIVLQKLAADADFETALNTVSAKYNDFYKLICASRVSADIESCDSWVTSQKKRHYAQTSDADVLSDTAGNIAVTLAAANAPRTALYYHAKDTEGLAASMASILCGGTVGTKAGFYKTPAGVTVDSITATEESKLQGNNVNAFLSFALASSARNWTTDGVYCDGEKQQKGEALDYLELSIQNAGLDAVAQDLPYDDRGVTALYDILNAVLLQAQSKEIISADSEDQKGYTVSVLNIADVKTQYPTYYSDKKFIANIAFDLALTGEKVEINLAY